MTVLDRVRQITAELHDIPVEEVTSGTDFFADLGDSLNFADSFMACEEAFGIKIDDKYFEEQPFSTVGELAAYFDAKLQAGGPL